MSSKLRAASVLGALLISRGVFADPDALWLEPSSNWHGIDGNWSSISLRVGEPAQAVDVTISTSLSEIWVVQTGGCSPNVLCTTARGNVYNISASTSWSSLGAWQLGLDYLGLGGNGDYAMETIVVDDSIRARQTTLKKQVVAGYNNTEYYTGFFGLGITPGRFKSVVVQSPISTLVELDGTIPSHSYGYTAGAYYRGTPVSLTLGGYDTNRFVAHGTDFSLNSTTRQPQVLVRGITASVPSLDKAPTNWTSPSLALMSFNESVTALIDSSTPYLWLPTAVCDRFAQALNLTWNETFGLYLFSNNATFGSFSGTDLSFTFTLSSTDNHDNFGQPLSVAGAVNITVSANAFAQTLRYPFMNLFKFNDAAIPYFPLKRSENANQIIIGRSFLQEAYMITNYETGSFSVHQALFPADPLRNTSIVTLTAAVDSPYPGVAASSGSEHGLGTAQIVGIAVGACLLGAVIVLMGWWLRRRKQHKRAEAIKDEEWKDKDSSTTSEAPRSPVGRLLSRITRKFPGRRNNQSTVYEVEGAARAVEVGADAPHARYEMAAHVPPVELDATDATSINGDTELGTEESHQLSAYEMARRKLERQLQGPAPEYMPSELPAEEPGKGYQDVSAVPHYRPSDHVENQNPSPTSTPSRDEFGNTLPSPLTPHGDWHGNPIPDIPSPLINRPIYPFPRSNSGHSTVHTPLSPVSYNQSPISRSASSSDSVVSSPRSLRPPPPAIQRTPIDPSRVVCLGPLPSNIRLPNQPPIPRIIGPDGETFAMSTMPMPPARRYSQEGGADTLGSNYTLDEDDEPQGTFGQDVHEPAYTGGCMTGEDIVHVPQIPIERRAPFSPGRIDGADLVHVPQPAPNRYSWEQERQ